MARIPMVTRTIKSTNCSCMCVDKIHAEIVNLDIVLPRTFKDTKEMAKMIEKQNLIPENYKLVDVVDFTVNEQLYGMSESDFLNYAKPVQRNTNKALEEN